MIGTVLGHFASPLVSADPRSAHLMMGEYGRALLEIACAEANAADILAGIGDGPLPWSATWTPALAELERRLVMDPLHLPRGLAPFVVHLGVEGVLSQADIRLPEPKALYWGTVALPKADRIAFRQENGSAEIDLYRPGAKVLRLSIGRAPDGRWAADGLDAENLPVVRFGPHLLGLHAGPAAPRYPLPTGRRVGIDDIGAADAIFSEAARLIEAHSPAFLPWIADAVRIVVPLDDDAGRMSATVKEFPGLVYLSLPADPVEVAARLVHEASHQYFYALQRVAMLHDGSDQNSYYSPIKKRGRPIELILFAFHAFCNGALFHRELAKADPRFETVVGETVGSMSEQLRALDEHLSATRALTPMGAMLWRPLADRLFGRRSG